MKNIIALLLIFSGFSTTISLSQTWYITRGLSTDEVAWAVDVDSTGNIYWAVEEKNVFPFWYYNILLFKIDPSGQQIWQSNPFGGQFNEIAFTAVVKGPRVYLAGRADSTGWPTSGDALVLSYNTDSGGLNWQYLYNPVPDNGYEEIDGMIIEPDGIYLTGWTKGATTDEDFLIQKISLSGQLIWTNSWDYNGMGKFDGANGHMAMDENFIYAAGHVNLLDGSLVCFSRSDGAYQWDVTWSGSANDEVLGLTMSPDSMLYTVGYFGSSQANSQTCIKKFTRAGQLIWSTNWGGTGTEDSRALVADGDSLLFVVGSTTSYGNGGSDIFILKYDTSGTLLDSLLWGGMNDEVASDVAMYGDYLYLTGHTSSFGNAQINGDTMADGLLLKIDARNMQAPDTSLSLVTENRSDDFSFTISPNPFNKTAKILLHFPHQVNTTIEILDVCGKIIKVIYSGRIEKGNREIYLDASGISNGIYFLKIQTSEFSQTGKFILHEN